jgi:hypothetical protein
MDEFIQYENLIIFKRRLADPNITDEQRLMLTRLLARAQDDHEKELDPAA